MSSIIIVKDDELTAFTCPRRNVVVLQSILIGQDVETRGMSTLQLFKGVKYH